MLNFSAYSSSHTICATNKNDTSNCVTCWGRVCSYFCKQANKFSLGGWENGCKYPIDLLSHIYCCLVNFRKIFSIGIQVRANDLPVQILQRVQIGHVDSPCWPKERFLVWMWLVSYSLHFENEFWIPGKFRPSFANVTISRDQIIISNFIGSSNILKTILDTLANA